MHWLMLCNALRYAMHYVRTFLVSRSPTMEREVVKIISNTIVMQPRQMKEIDQKRPCITSCITQCITWCIT